MAEKISWENFFESLGGRVGGYYRGIADKNLLVEKIAKSTCFIASNDYRFARLGAYGRGFYKSLCGNLDTPIVEKPVSPSQGQCPVAYRSVITYVFEGNTTTRDVGAWFGKYIETKFTNGGEKITIVAGAPNSPNLRTEYNFLATGNAGRPFSSFVVDRIYRLDGGPDNCGVEPPLPQPVDVTHTHDGENSPTIYTYNPPSIFTPKICFESAKVRICISPDGIDITGLGDDGNPSSDYGDKSDKQEEEDKEREEFDEKEVLDWVLVSISNLKEKTKLIVREDEKDTVVFAGYLVWEYKSEQGDIGYTQQQEIRKFRNAFKAPDNIEGYRVYTNDGLIATVTEIKKKIKVPKPPKTP